MLIYILIALTLLSTLIIVVPAKYKSWLAIALVFSIAVVSSIEALEVLISNTTKLIELGSWQFFGAQHAAIDSLSAIFLIMISVASFSCVVYASGNLKHKAHSNSPASLNIHYMAMVLMCAAMMAVVVMRSGFGFMLAWELMTISSFVLMLLEASRREVMRAALIYLLVMHVGFILLLTGFVTLTANGLAPDLDSLGAYFAMPNRSPIALFVIFLIGFGLKAGIFPLHWIKPITDPVSPTHVAALMSGVMIKTGIYGVIRVVSQIDSSLDTIAAIVLSIGIVTGLWGIIMASAQNNIKRLLAYSSVENVGIIFIGIGISILGRYYSNDTVTILGMGGAILHSLNHSFFKPMLIMGAGSIQNATGTLHMDQLGGLSNKMPITAILFFIGSAAISALPALNGFVGEFLIYKGLFEALSQGSTQALAAIAVLLFLTFIGGIVVLAFTKLFGIIFLGSARSPRSENAREVSSEMIIGSIIPLTGVLTIGLFPILAYNIILPISAEIYSIESYQTIIQAASHSATRISLVIFIFFALALGLWYIRNRTIKKNGHKESSVWGCAFTAITNKMQYTGESFSDELHSLTESVTRDKLHTKDSTKNSIFPSSEKFEIKHKDKVETLFTSWWVEMIRVVNSKLDFFVTNKVNHYIFYALGFLVLIFLLSILNLI